MHKPPYELRNKRVWVAGHRGLVGSALVRRLEREGCDVLTVGRHHCDLRNSGQVDKWMKDLRPDAVFLAAAHVGGIHANDTRPAEFIYDNLMIEANIIDSAHRSGVEKLLFLGSSCIYPRMAPQPIPEEALLTGPLEPTNQWYAIAKIAGIKLCQAYRRQYGCDFTSVMPTNLYGPGDNFDLMGSHVVPALMVKAHKAKQEGAKTLEIWGSGTPLRELLFVDDAADGMVFVMKHYSEEEPLNLGSSQEVSIAELAERICRVVGFQGQIVHDRSKPDGTPRKIMDNGRLEALGWRAPTSIDDGLAQTYRWYVENIGSVRGAPVVHA
ncbi:MULTISPECIES: GDP-L-fucose synthase [Nitrospirillum]|uniref:GDP-L-fucose synthase n=1 Tax=Nitrospirillum amazonense TaxID=28077 RepID=A0A560GDJ5_9PROT|nr:GDP-L-fucose synthase [Nitrospirillum amazonense]MEC4592230.1 GDP-L-fucose synthase [Nitrospirillum amazonense]TWB31985.1 GDP-L-fucose synthase [Nitrospirillum amazonense]